VKDEIVLYRPDALANPIEVRLDEAKETLWLTRDQMAALFGKERSVITKHLKNIFKKDELDEKVVSAFFAQTTQHGAIKGKTQTKNVKFYNLDAILSVGYLVNSKQGTQFRQWASRVLKDYLLKGYTINNRMNRLVDCLQVLLEKVKQINKLSINGI